MTMPSAVEPSLEPEPLPEPESPWAQFSALMYEASVTALTKTSALELMHVPSAKALAIALALCMHARCWCHWNERKQADTLHVHDAASH